MNQALVSILIPVYNREKLVARAIESALRQTYDNIEIVAVDNKSTDGTYEVLKDYQTRYTNVRVYQNEENVGPVRNWKKCLEYSSGEFVKILFSDDWMDRSFVEKCIHLLLSHGNIGFAYTTALVHLGDKTEMAYGFSEKSGIYDTNIFIKGCILESGFPVSPGTALFRRKDVENNLLIEIPNDLCLDFAEFGAGNDVLISLLTAVRYPYFGYISEPLTHFGAPGDSLTMSHNLSLYYLVAREYFVGNCTDDRYLKRTFYSKMWLRSVKNKGIYSQLVDRKEVRPLSIIKELFSYSGRRFL